MILPLAPQASKKRSTSCLLSCLAQLRGAQLCEAFTSYVGLSYVRLCLAQLCEAQLCEASTSYVGLSYVRPCLAQLCGAQLCLGPRPGG